MSRKVVLLLALLTVFTVFSVTNVLAADTPKNPDTYVHVSLGNQSTMDPHYAYDTGSSEVIYQIYETLVDYEGSSVTDFKPLLATKVPTVENGLIKDNGLTYVFPIRQGVEFSNGDPMTPEDVKYSFLRGMVMDRTSGPMWMIFEPLFGDVSTLSGLSEKVVGVKDPKKLTPEQSAKVFAVMDKKIEIDGNNVIFHLANPYPPFLNILAKGASWSSIIDKKWSIKQGAWDGNPETIAKYHDPTTEDDPLYDKTMGTGPFVLSEWVNGDHVMFTRNDNYWRKPANFKTVFIDTVDEPTTRILMLKRGDADSIQLSYQYFNQIEGVDGINVVKGIPRLQNTNMLLNWTINTKGNPYVGSGKLDGNGVPADFFNDVHVRRAFSYCFNYKAFIDQVRQGQSMKLRGPIVSPLLGYDENSAVYALDLDKAKEEFKKAFGGELWDKGFKVTIAYNSGNAARQTAADIFKTYIEQINPKFHIDTQAVQWSTYLDQSERGLLPMQIGGWLADFPDPHNFVQPFLASTSYYGNKRGANYKTWAEKNVDGLITQGIQEQDKAKRTEIYKKIQKIANDQAIDVWLDQALSSHISRTWVKGWYPNAMRPGYDFYILDK